MKVITWDPFDTFVKLAMRHSYKCCYCGKFITAKDVTDGRKTRWVEFNDSEWDSNAECYVPYSYNLCSHIKCYNKAKKLNEIANELDPPAPKLEHPAINGYNRYDYIPVEGIRQPKPEPKELTMKFETINGQLCRMVEPEPLTDKSQFPCVVRLIQDDSPMGRFNHRNYDDCSLGKNAIATHMIDVLKIFYAPISAHLAVEKFEIIGYPVADGSAEWALYHMMQGKSITFSDQPNRVLRLVNGYIQDSMRDGYWNGKSDNEFLSYASFTGWQIYEEPQTIDSDRWACFECGVKDSRKGHFPGCSRDGKPKSTYKVGDWVTDGAVQGRVVTRTSDTTWVEVQDGKQYHIETSHLRKLDPSEVVIHIGCMSGTVRPVSTNGIHIWFHLIDADDKIIATIRIKSLDAPTRELVESLLKAQEEE